jgi:hypothetical protein
VEDPVHIILNVVHKQFINAKDVVGMTMVIPEDPHMKNANHASVLKEVTCV